MKSLFKRFLGDEDGLETIEVIIILIISVAAAGVLTAFFYNVVVNKVDEAGEVIEGIDLGGGGTGGGTGGGSPT